MSMTADKLVAEALALSPQARAFVAEKLIESLDVQTGPDLSPAWREEIRKRSREVDEGLVTLRDAKAVFSTAHSSLE